jgi:hypothetical protein
MKDIKLPEGIYLKEAQTLTIRYIKIEIEKSRKRLESLNEKKDKLEIERRELIAYKNGMIKARDILLGEEKGELLK